MISEEAEEGDIQNSSNSAISNVLIQPCEIHAFVIKISSNSISCADMNRLMSSESFDNRKGDLSGIFSCSMLLAWTALSSWWGLRQYHISTNSALIQHLPSSNSLLAQR